MVNSEGATIYQSLAQLNSNSLVRARFLAHPNPSLDIKMLPLPSTPKAHSARSRAMRQGHISRSSSLFCFVFEIWMETTPLDVPSSW